MLQNGKLGERGRGDVPATGDRLVAQASRDIGEHLGFMDGERNCARLIGIVMDRPRRRSLAARVRSSFAASSAESG